MVAACGGGGAATALGPGAPSAMSVPTLASAGDASVEAASMAFADASAIPAPTPPPRPRALVLDFGDDETLLFSDERARVIDVVRERFAKQTIAPVDMLRPAELAALDA